MRRVVQLAVGAGVPAALLASGWLAIDRLGGASRFEPEDLEAGIGPEARALIDAAWDGIDPARVLDHHTHVVGLGSGGSGAWVNPYMQTWTRPVRRLTFAVYTSAARISDLSRADEQYLDRLTRLAQAPRRRGRYALLAFDYHYSPDGTRDLERSEFHMPDERVFAIAAARPELFEPVMSVHPYRPGALQALRQGAARGARMVKWLPNAMGIDASDPALDAYYETLVELDVALLTHVGEEQAVEAEELQRLGNPLLFRRALDAGVTVVMAHCASLGESDDLDRPGGVVPAFELFLRLMDEPAYADRLYGELSAMLQANRIGTPLTTMLRRTDLHARLVNGSDYPLPAINVVVRTGALASQGYIDAAERDALNEIYDYDPLLFDFVAKRTVRAPDTGERFAPEVFHARNFAARPDAPPHDSVATPGDLRSGSAPPTD